MAQSDPGVVTTRPASTRVVGDASFVAVTRTMLGDVQLLVEVDSPKHVGLYHAIGGKSNPGEYGHDTINRELVEECQLIFVRDRGWRVEWKTLGDEDLLDKKRQATTDEGVQLGPRSYYLYPEEVEEVRSAGASVRWVSLERLSALNSTFALNELVTLLRNKMNGKPFSPVKLRKLQRITHEAVPTSVFVMRVSGNLHKRVDKVQAYVRSWWTRDLERFASDGEAAVRKGVWMDLISRLSTNLDRDVTDIIRAILRGDIELVNGLTKISALFSAVQSQVGSFFTHSANRAYYETSFRLEGFGGQGLISSLGEHENRQILAGWPFGLAEGLEVLLDSFE